MIDFMMDHFVFCIILLVSILISGVILLSCSVDYQAYMDMKLEDLTLGNLFMLVIIHASLLNMGRRQ